jgi:WhiB family redox-sensing transcriptional regulator
MEQGACRGCDPALFFPERGENGGQAKLICSVCPVRVECLDHALASHERYGVWGGQTDKERRAEARARRRIA